MKDQELAVQLLGMKLEGYYAVVALGMDIWGYGETEQSATVNLQQHIHMQIAYLVRTDKVELIHRRARAEYYDMYDECVISRIRNEAVPGWWICSLSIPLEKNKRLSGVSRVGASTTIKSPAARYAAGVCRRIAA